MNRRNIDSLLQLYATPALLLLLGFVLVFHPDSASALLARICGWVLIAVGAGLMYTGVTGGKVQVVKVVSALACLYIGGWILRNPLRLAEAFGRIAGILLVLRSLQDVSDAHKKSGGLTLIIGIALFLLPKTASRLVFILCGVAALAAGGLMLADRIRRNRLTPPDDSIIDAL